jgi:hypothetical protein
VVSFSEQGKVEITFPELNVREDIQAPVGCTKVFINIVMTGCSVEQSASFGIQHSTIEIDYLPGTKLSQNIEFNAPSENCLMMVVVGLRYEVDRELKEDERWRPVGIVGSC